MSSPLRTPLFAGGKCVAISYEYPDGRFRLTKPALTERHILDMTGAPGWDKGIVDRAFAGRDGTLEWTWDGYHYAISIKEFREHAFVKKIGDFSEQYHVHAKFYDKKSLDAPATFRRNSQPVEIAHVNPAVFKDPPKLSFGEVLLCPQCGGTTKQPMKKKPGSCERCNGYGVIPWKLETQSG